jgi:hypothetical protein
MVDPSNDSFSRELQVPTSSSKIPKSAFVWDKSKYFNLDFVGNSESPSNTALFKFRY